MTYYKCGHDRGIIVLSDNVVGIMNYFEWKDSTGFDGDKTECHKCYVKRIMINDKEK